MSVEEMIELGKRHKGQKVIIELARNAFLNECLSYEGRTYPRRKMYSTIDHVLRAGVAHRVLDAAGGRL